MYNMAIMKNTAKRWGHSLGVIIPAEIAKKIKLKEGSCKFKYTSSFLVPLPPGYEQKFVPVKLKVGV